MIKFIKRWRNWWCAVIALVVTLGFALSYTPRSFLALRSPIERETVLYYFAQRRCDQSQTPMHILRLVSGCPIIV